MILLLRLGLVSTDAARQSDISLQTRLLSEHDYICSTGVGAGCYAYNALLGGAAAAADITLAQQLYTRLTEAEVLYHRAIYVPRNIADLVNQPLLHWRC